MKKETKNVLLTGKEVANGLFLTPKCKVLFHDVFELSKYNNQYGITVMFDKSEVDFTVLKAWLDANIKLKFPKLPMAFNMPIIDTDANTPAAAKYSGFPNHWILKAGSTEKFKPEVRDAASKLISEKDSEIYSGVIVRLVLETYVYDARTSKTDGVKLNLKAVQKVADAPRLATQKQTLDIDSIFDPLEVEPEMPADGALKDPFEI